MGSRTLKGLQCLLNIVFFQQGLQIVYYSNIFLKIEHYIVTLQANYLVEIQLKLRVLPHPLIERRIPVD